MSENKNDFFTPREIEKGGKTTYRTYATWFAKKNEHKEEYGVLAYIINNVIYLENFERETAIFGFNISSRKEKNEPFEKWEGSIDINSIASCYQVSRSAAEKKYSVYMDDTPLKEATKLDKLFLKLVTQITTRDGSIYFLELISHKEFIKAIQGE